MAADSNRRGFLKQAGGAGLVLSAPATAAAQPAAPDEWRNKQSGMAYRRLGRTGLMVSEFGSGGDPIRSKNYDHLSLAVEMGLNYLDMAPAYGGGDCEIAYGKFLGGSSSRRAKVFLTTKVSGYGQLRDALYKDVYDGLGPAKQERIMAEAARLMAESGSAKPGYYLDYFPNQFGRLEDSYRSNAMMADYSHKVEESPKFQEHIIKQYEESLKRVGVDAFDNLMCPHGACTPEELAHPALRSTFEKLKKDGKVRFLGVTAHNNPGAVLRKAAELGYFDLAMVAYNVVNGGYLEEAIRIAKSKDMGVIAMKSAMAVATHHKPLQPTPQWRIDKINRIVPGEMKAPLKAYLWSLQNPGINMIVSNLWDPTFIKENLGLAGKTVELKSA